MKLYNRFWHIIEYHSMPLRTWAIKVWPDSKFSFHRCLEVDSAVAYLVPVDWSCWNNMFPNPSIKVLSFAFVLFLITWLITGVETAKLSRIQIGGFSFWSTDRARARFICTLVVTSTGAWRSNQMYLKVDGGFCKTIKAQLKTLELCVSNSPWMFSVVLKLPDAVLHWTYNNNGDRYWRALNQSKD